MKNRHSKGLFRLYILCSDVVLTLVFYNYLKLLQNTDCSDCTPVLYKNCYTFFYAKNAQKSLFIIIILILIISKNSKNSQNNPLSIMVLMFPPLFPLSPNVRTVRTLFLNNQKTDQENFNEKLFIRG